MSPKSINETRELSTDLTLKKKCTIPHLSRDAAAVTPLNLTKTTTNGRNEHYLKQCTAAQATPQSTVA